MGGDAQLEIAAFVGAGVAVLTEPVTRFVGEGEREAGNAGVIGATDKAVHDKRVRIHVGDGRLDDFAGGGQFSPEIFVVREHLGGEPDPSGRGGTVFGDEQFLLPGERGGLGAAQGAEFGVTGGAVGVEGGQALLNGLAGDGGIELRKRGFGSIHRRRVRTF